MDIAQYSTFNLIEIVSNLLESILQSNRNIPDKITHFHSRAIPNITILSYLSRIHKFAPFDNEALISILIYFDRITKLLITSLVIASKFTSDVFYSNSRYAKVGGIPLQELNQLEIQFLFFLDFQLYVTLEDLQGYANQLLSHAVNTSIISTHKQQNRKYQLSHIVSTITSSSLTSPPYSKKSLRSHIYHPYQRPHTTDNKKLGLISPKDSS
ncbi:hypothetical protein G6F46_003291 [Rhizopus delemar]|uniref:Cyclin n=2 Tax=Rhizopus TaxID=4842 RepID=A0A9P6YVE1_9FUNG|nr:hypothetical protein G6F55_009812 [Rhizopus delemar]KAG1536910.1 hypothetical protein G6F51_010691 [Rhizopus arrhizus]KAG1491207.1 hypothetical protein G6F54_010183 [Rhizopus delemar]KAG1518412.1 hypothetical protein G6F53_000600 [Rhizopus delemar]KAG1550163.1 hypothetical protein G6F49_009375 [Rhizopus delemar]